MLNEHCAAQRPTIWRASALAVAACVEITGCGTVEAEAVQRARAKVRAELALNAVARESYVEQLEERLDRAQVSLGLTKEVMEDLRVRLDDAEERNARLREENARLLAELTSLRERVGRSRRREGGKASAEVVGPKTLSALVPLVQRGVVEVLLRNGNWVLQLPAGALFESGRAEIGASGRIVLLQVATALRTLTTYKIHVAGHTDNLPMTGSRFLSNWELSIARALAVLKLLAMEGVPQEVLAVVGYGQFAPLVSNATLEGRARNRRTEITLVPTAERTQSDDTDAASDLHAALRDESIGLAR